MTGIEIEAFSESVYPDFSKSWSDVCISVIDGGSRLSTRKAVTGIGVDIEAFKECRPSLPVLSKL